MKQLFLATITLATLLCQFSCSSSSFVSYDSNIESIIVTSNESNVRGLSMLGYITVTYKIPMFSEMTEDEMRQGAIQRLKKKAKKEGAKVVLITEESFTPFDPTYKIRELFINDDIPKCMLINDVIWT